MSVITPPVALSPSKLGTVLEVFESNFRRYDEIGASISIWWQGNELLCHASGWCEKEQLRPWTERTLIPVYSATKVSSAATLLLALANHGMDESTPLREVWKNFPVAEANFSHLLSHQCGLAILDQDADVHDHDAVVAAIENQIPTWPLGNGHAYHPRSFGALTDEPVRRLTGQTLGQYWREKIGAPLDLEFWIGLPDSEHHRVARLYPGKAGHAEISDPFYQQLNSPDSPTRRAFTSPRGLHSIHEMNSPKAWTAGFPALGGIGTAIIVAIFGIFAILVLEFGSFRSTLIVLTVVPLGIFGGMLMLLVTNNDISFTASIGFIALIGIEIKNSILLVDFTNQLREEGVPLDEAIERAGEIRFLPILLTSATAIGGLLPLAVQNIGLYSPMAWVIIGGLVTSTLLARLVTPVVYKLIPPSGHEPKPKLATNPDAPGVLL